MPFRKMKAKFRERSPMSWPIVPETAINKINNLLRAGEISTSREVDKFASEFAKFTGAKYCLPEVNGTAALYSAFKVLGLGPNDEVICPTYTYWASATPAASLGVKVIFAESDPRSFCIDPEDIKRKITEHTRAIVVVHLWGYPADMDAIMQIASENNLKVIEDASHAHGAYYRGKHVGTIGDIGCFSTQASKLLPAGEGGFLITDNVEYYEKAIVLAHYQKTRKFPSSHPYKKYQNTAELKFRMSPLHAVIGRELLKDFHNYNAIITKNAEKIRSSICELPGFIDNTPLPHIKRVHFEDVIDYQEDISGKSRKKLVAALKVSCPLVNTSRYPLLHQQAYFTERGSDPKDLVKTSEMVSRLFRLPKYRTDAPYSVDKFLNRFHRAFNRL